MPYRLPMKTKALLSKAIIYSLLALCFNSEVAFAECKALIPTLSDSRFFQIANLASNTLDADKTTLAIRSLERQLDCSVNSIEITSLSCDDTLTNFFLSPVCRADTEAGYFIVLEDMVGNVNLIFNRWD